MAQSLSLQLLQKLRRARRAEGGQIVVQIEYRAVKLGKRVFLLYHEVVEQGELEFRKCRYILKDPKVAVLVAEGGEAAVNIVLYRALPLAHEIGIALRIGNGLTAYHALFQLAQVYVPLGE